MESCRLLNDKKNNCAQIFHVEMRYSHVTEGLLRTRSCIAQIIAWMFSNNEQKQALRVLPDSLSFTLTETEELKREDNCGYHRY